MFFLSKVFAILILPPGLFAILLLLALLLLHRRRRRAARTVLWFLFLAVYLLSIRPVADNLILPLEDQFATASDSAGFGAKCDVIVVLGGGVVPGSPEWETADAASAETMARALAGFRIWRKHPVPIVLSGGFVYEGTGAVAEAMASVLRALGVPRPMLILEDKSRNTIQNAEFSAAVLARQGWTTPCLVTSAYHIPRAMMSFARYDVAAVPVPAAYRAYRAPYSLRHFFPDVGSLQLSRQALHEYVGIVFYKIKHGI